MGSICECGCGGTPRIPTNRFIWGHENRRTQDDWTEVDRGYKTPCWVWRNGGSEHYGTMRVHGRTDAAHRVYYEELIGLIPDGMWVLHHCDVRRCVNPAHLFLGTQADNMRDMKEKGRSGWNPRYGKDHPHCKVSWEDVQRIREERAKGRTVVDIGREFNTSFANVSAITNYRTRKVA